MRTRILIGVAVVAAIVGAIFFFSGRNAAAGKSPQNVATPATTPTPAVTPSPPSEVEEKLKSWGELLEKAAAGNGGTFKKGLAATGADQVALVKTPTKLVVVASHGDNVKVWTSPKEARLLPAGGWVVVFYKPDAGDYASVAKKDAEAKCPFGQPPGGKFGLFQAREFPCPEERRAAGKVAMAEGYYVEGPVPSPEKLREMFPDLHDVQVVQTRG
ncbi:MAG TPA: hypothetical protein VJJ47_00145 [Candidatus Paceibacterota bacterium]